MNTIQLQRTIRVRTFDAPATIAIGRQRPEWLAVARLTKDFGGEISAQQIARELLAGVPPEVGNRVIERCVALGLLDQSSEERKSGIAHLSKLGEEALQSGQVFVPEERNWRFYFAADPLLEQALLHVEPLDSGSAHHERNELREAKKRGEDRSNDGEECPDCVRAAQAAESVIHSVVEQSPSFVLTTAPQRGAWANDQSLRLQLTWAQSGQPSVRLTGKMNPSPHRTERGEQPTRPEPLCVNLALAIPAVLAHLKHEQVWLELAAFGTRVNVQTLQVWRQRAGRLVVPVGYSDCPVADRNSFRTDIPIPEIPSGLPGAMELLGHFDHSTLPGVELVPASEDDAQLWAEWLLRQSLNDYATPKRLNELAATTRERFEFHTPSLPTPQTMLDTALAKPTEAKSRFILAPYDLGLWS